MSYGGSSGEDRNVSLEPTESKARASAHPIWSCFPGRLLRTGHVAGETAKADRASSLFPSNFRFDLLRKATLLPATTFVRRNRKGTYCLPSCIRRRKRSFLCPSAKCVTLKIPRHWHAQTLMWSFGKVSRTKGGAIVHGSAYISFRSRTGRTYFAGLGRAQFASVRVAGTLQPFPRIDSG